MPKENDAAGASDTSTETQASISEQAQVTTAPQGSRARKAFMPKQLVPDPDWINKNIVANGKGTRATLGRVYGVAMDYKVKVNALPNGGTAESTCLQGKFQIENFVTGELSDAVEIYLPDAYSMQVRAMMAADESIKVVEVDVDVGVEATGKTIPYEWVITAYRNGDEMAVLKRLREGRRRPEGHGVLTSAAGKPLAIAAPAE